MKGCVEAARGKRAGPTAVTTVSGGAPGATVVTLPSSSPSSPSPRSSVRTATAAAAVHGGGLAERQVVGRGEEPLALRSHGALLPSHNRARQHRHRRRVPTQRERREPASRRGRVRERHWDPEAGVVPAQVPEHLWAVGAQPVSGGRPVAKVEQHVLHLLAQVRGAQVYTRARKHHTHARTGHRGGGSWARGLSSLSSGIRSCETKQKPWTVVMSAKRKKKRKSRKDKNSRWPLT